MQGQRLVIGRGIGYQRERHETWREVRVAHEGEILEPEGRPSLGRCSGWWTLVRSSPSNWASSHWASAPAGGRWFVVVAGALAPRSVNEASSTHL